MALGFRFIKQTLLDTLMSLVCVIVRFNKVFFKRKMSDRLEKRLYSRIWYDREVMQQTTKEITYLFLTGRIRRIFR